jgi:hypothetical protein
MAAASEDVVAEATTIGRRAIWTVADFRHAALTADVSAGGGHLDT